MLVLLLADIDLLVCGRLPRVDLVSIIRAAGRVAFRLFVSYKALLGWELAPTTSLDTP